MGKLAPKIHTVYECLVNIATSGQSLFLLPVRLSWGWQFFVKREAELANPGQVAEFFERSGIPMFALNAFPTGTTEFCGKRESHLPSHPLQLQNAI